MTTHPKIRVVIAEDDALVAGITRHELESVGFAVVGIAANGKSAVDMALELQPDVVLMDITMPKMDGIEAAAAIQAGRPTPVVILTAHDERELVAKATAAGVGAFVLKPPQADELERAITIAMARHADLVEMRRLNDEVKKALDEVRTLKGFLPICCSCKKIRDDKGYWEQVEDYVLKHTDAKFSHGYCPDCLKQYFPGIDSRGIV
jgi:AmiR/NasT family two-component response regulator